jgi:TFIIF-interacting CTD phosphatase-like protein
MHREPLHANNRHPLAQDSVGVLLTGDYCLFYREQGGETAKPDGTVLDSTGDEESDADFEDDYDEFDPFEFIKNLPENPSKDSLTMVLPKKTRGQPPVSLVLDLDETLVHASLEFMENAHLTVEHSARHRQRAPSQNL